MCKILVKRQETCLDHSGPQIDYYKLYGVTQSRQIRILGARSFSNCETNKRHQRIEILSRIFMTSITVTAKTFIFKREKFTQNKRNEFVSYAEKSE